MYPDNFREQRVFLRRRGLYARVQTKTNFLFEFERGHKARGYKLLARVAASRLHCLEDAIQVVGLRRLQRGNVLYDISSFSHSCWPMGSMFQSY